MAQAPVAIDTVRYQIYIQAGTTALSYPWKHLIGCHLGRLATREHVTLHQQYHVTLHQQYLDDISVSVRAELDTTDPTPYGSAIEGGTSGAPLARYHPPYSLLLTPPRRETGS